MVLSRTSLSSRPQALMVSASLSMLMVKSARLLCSSGLTRNKVLGTRLVGHRADEQNKVSPCLCHGARHVQLNVCLHYERSSHADAANRDDAFIVIIKGGMSGHLWLVLFSCNCCQISLFYILQTLKEHTHAWTAWSQSDGRAGSSLPGSEVESLKLDSLSILAVCNCCKSQHLGCTRFECHHLGSFKKTRPPAQKGVEQNHHEANPAVLQQAVVDSFSNSLK